MNKKMKGMFLIPAILVGSAVAASAEGLAVESLTAAITAGIGSATTLIVAGFAVVALFITVKLIKKGAAKIG